MYSTELSRGRKLLIPKDNAQAEDFIQNEAVLFMSCVNTYIRELLEWIKASDFEVTGITDHGEVYLREEDEGFFIGPSGGFFRPITKRKNGEPFAKPKWSDTQLKAMFSHVFNETDTHDSCASWKLNIIANGANKIKSSIKRFKKRGASYNDYIREMKPPVVSNPTICHKKALAKIKDNVLVIKGANKQEVKITDFFIPYKEYTEVHKKTFGGNLVLSKKKNSKHNEYTIMIKCKKHFYSPLGWIGMDINKYNPEWLAIAEDAKDGFYNILPKPDNIDKIEKIRDDIDKMIDNKERSSGSTKRRARLRKAKDRAVSAYRREIKKFLLPMLDFIQLCRFGLCLDGVATKGRSFGQQEINSILEKECIRRNIPFAMTNPRMTTRSCYYCEENNPRPKTSGPDAGVYICGNPLCPKFESREIPHVNAARNIARQGKKRFLESAVEEGIASPT
jgi:hypothetical protein